MRQVRSSRSSSTSTGRAAAAAVPAAAAPAAAAAGIRRTPQAKPATRDHPPDTTASISDRYICQGRSVSSSSSSGSGGSSSTRAHLPRRHKAELLAYSRFLRRQRPVERQHIVAEPAEPQRSGDSATTTATASAAGTAAAASGAPALGAQKQPQALDEEDGGEDRAHPVHATRACADKPWRAESAVAGQERQRRRRRRRRRRVAAAAATGSGCSSAPCSSRCMMYFSPGQCE